MFQLKSLLIIATLGLLALADPYKTLGVSKQATPQRIASAFKRKAIDYHPKKLENEIVFNDALLKQNQQSFYEAAAAYSEIKYGYKLDTTTLNSDNYEEFFFKFFQNGQVCGQTGPNQFECEASNKPNGYYSAYKKSKCIDMNIETIGQFLDRKEAWLIHNYESVEKMEKDAYMVKAFAGAADLMKDELFYVGVTDCQYESEICDYFKEDSDQGGIQGWAFPVKGDRKSVSGFVTSAETYKTFAMNTFQNFTIDEMYEQTVPRTVRKAKAEDKKIAILFTENNTTPKVWTIIGQYFEPWFIFGTSNKKNTKMVEKFGVKTFPTIVIIDDPNNVGNVQYYTGEVEKEGIIEHLKQFRKPEIHEFQKLTKEAFDADKLCQRSDGKFCFIYNVQNDESLINAVAELPKIYKKKPLRFLYVQEAFGEQLDNKPGFAIIKSKRGRYVFEQAQNVKVEDFIEQALDGSLNYVPMPKDIFESFKFY